MLGHLPFDDELHALLPHDAHDGALGDERAVGGTRGPGHAVVGFHASGEALVVDVLHHDGGLPDMGGLLLLSAVAVQRTLRARR